jgi:AbrB family looped-hinge helix DNA binding protein
MPSERQTYHLKVDSSGRIVLPADARDRQHIANGDTVVVIEDESGLHVKTHRHFSDTH